MQKSVKPSTISGSVKAPASKSMMQRAIAAALLSDTPVTLTNPTYSNDSKAALSVIQALGAQVEAGTGQIHIHGAGGVKPTGARLCIGESGLGIRMFSPILSLSHQPLTIDAEGSLLKRPVSMIEAPLRQLGVDVTTSQGFPPLTVKGPLKGGTAVVDGSVSSQLLTGLLMALPKAQGDSVLTVDNLKSTPYIDMTLGLLKDFGVAVHHTDYRVFSIKGNQRYIPSKNTYWVEGDWSGAAFLLVSGAVGGSVNVTGLDPHSPQADRRIIDALYAAGAVVTISETGSSIQVSKPQTHLKGFEFDATHCPDLFPPLTALAINCRGETVLTGVERLTHKESNRAVALEKEFSALGGQMQVTGNRMIITGTTLTGGTIDSHNDHRIAMAGAVAAINAANPVTITNPGCVAKSYPAFFEDFAAIGGISHE